MKFIADLHIHSRFSRATAKNLDFPHLYMAARQKGISVIATGDFTHPLWLDEIRQYLEPAEPGLFKLKSDFAKQCEKQIAVAGENPVRFMLGTEISNIYKKDGATRKLHHLVFFPELCHVEKFNARLSAIGNLKSDGRPILGLDSKNLLEIMLETHESGFLVPAHIWTPWFSLFGSRSGFDSIEQCFEDLSDNIFAVETGLSSDPPMNWRVTDLDNCTLISNSDAHSPANLGREANLFDTDLSYFAIRSAIETGDPKRFLGTLEFFPEEGKYHQDGHRKCGVNFNPKQTIENKGICPVCKAPLTVGVLYRVEELAGRKQGEKPERNHPFYSLIPLAEILSELLGVGPKSKKVIHAWQSAISRIGPELNILHDLPIDVVRNSGSLLLAEAIERMRQGRVHRHPGFDGQYGRVTIFTPEERQKLTGQQALFDIPAAAPHRKKSTAKESKTAPAETKSVRQSSGLKKKPEQSDHHPILQGLNQFQYKAVTHKGGPILISAGPGTGKTRTLTCRIAWLIKTGAAAPRQILAVTFTQKAAGQMQKKLSDLLGNDCDLPAAMTFHAFCFSLLKEFKNTPDHGIADEENRIALIKEAMEAVKTQGIKISDRAEGFADHIAAAKQKVLYPGDDLHEITGINDISGFSCVYAAYQELLDAERLWDYEDLICRTIIQLESDPALCKALQKRFAFVFVDEYQDLNYAQYRLVLQLCPKEGNICVIGDPDQSIYGFRGSDPSYFARFAQDFSNAEIICLRQNYRSTETILSASSQVLGPKGTHSEESRIFSGIKGTRHIHLINAASEKAEAVTVGKIIEQMVGGMGFDFRDFDKSFRFCRDHEDRSFSDFAVLFRTRAQGQVFAEIFGKAGIPFQLANKAGVWGALGVAEHISAFKILEGQGSGLDLQRLIKILEPGFSTGNITALRIWARSRNLSVNGLLAEAHRTGVSGMDNHGNTCLNNFLKQLSALEEITTGPEVEKKLKQIIGFVSRFLPEPDERKKETIRDLLQLAAGFKTDAAGFISALALKTDPDLCGADSEKVSLLTLHAAKGLEFPVVFIAGCEDGLIPYHGSARQAADCEEERRLFYVAMTRAMSELFLLSSRSRKIYGKTSEQNLSPFIAMIPKDLKKEISMEKPQVKNKQIQLNLF